LRLDIAYLHTKFDHSSFSRFRDMFGANRKLNGSCDLATPLSGRDCHHALPIAAINLSTTFEVSISTHYEDTKQGT